MSVSEDEQVTALIAKAKPAELRRMARWAVEMVLAEKAAAAARNYRSVTMGNRFTVASHMRDHRESLDNIREVVEMLKGRLDREGKRDDC